MEFSRSASVYVFYIKHMTLGLLVFKLSQKIDLSLLKHVLFL